MIKLNRYSSKQCQFKVAVAMPKGLVYGIIATIIFFCFLMPSTCYASDYILSWTDNNHTVDGYRIYLRAENTAYNYNSPVWTGKATSTAIIGLDEQTTYYAVIRAFSGTIESKDSNEVQINPRVNPGNLYTAENYFSYIQDRGKDGIVSIEVENYDLNVSQGDHEWVLIYPPNYSGTGAVQALPNINRINNRRYTKKSPRLDFEVNFVKTGTHYVWVKGIGKNGNDDSVHVGLDNIESASSDRISAFNSNWSWSNRTMDGQPATFHIATTGVHTINVWMREDGFIIDKVVLTTNVNYIPINEGPPETIPQNNK